MEMANTRGCDSTYDLLTLYTTLWTPRVWGDIARAGTVGAWRRTWMPMICKGPCPIHPVVEDLTRGMSHRLVGPTSMLSFL